MIGQLCKWNGRSGQATATRKTRLAKEDTMKTWMKPQVREQEVGLEVTSYLPAEIDII